MAKRKKEMLEAVAALSKGNHMITDSINQNIGPRIELLAECQKLAFGVGTVLEAYGSGSKKMVRILEDYCECLYQISISRNNMESCRKLAKKIRKQMMQVYTRIRFEIPDDRKEIVFLPYKVSMWDSLESVWKAAIKDECCDVYVISVPYFDREPDGTLGKMHDEEKEYPEYVPVLSWKEFSIEEHRPDIIYIHNPYDQYNYVTSVHPDFYAARLKNTRTDWCISPISPRLTVMSLSILLLFLAFYTPIRLSCNRKKRVIFTYRNSMNLKNKIVVKIFMENRRIRFWRWAVRNMTKC